ncbi:glycosyltransferase [Algoriphagus hitonicola]|nr:glycosyltransferase [Algoriphagus hitonicola]
MDLPETDKSQVSLIIPFRNESENAEELLRQLAKMEANVGEILLVNDHSEDDSRIIFERGAGDSNHIKILDSPGIGKKAAVEFAVKQAKGSIILVSDADCTFSETWVKKLLAQFSDPTVQLVAGPVLSQMERDGFLDRFQQIEWASILLLTHYFFHIQKPLMCSAANLAYRKATFIAVGGFSGNANIASGDDEFLLKKIMKKYGPASCRYLRNQETLVWTRPQEDFFALLNQRMRWAGKWKKHSSFSHLMTSVVFAAFQMVWISSFCLPFFGGFFTLIFLGIWGVKIGMESRVLGKVLRSFGISIPIEYYIKTGFFHPLYVLLTVSGIFFGKFVWKGRSD